MLQKHSIALLTLCLSAAAFGQRFELRPAERWVLPALIDSNTPSFWMDGQFYLMSSTGSPMLYGGADPAQIQEIGFVNVAVGPPQPAWIESVWMDEYGILFAWYHHEELNVCPGATLTAPKIGAAMSWDGGRTLIDLGFVLETSELPDCSAKNGYFAGGHGDFSVVFDSTQGYFYFFFSNYSGATQEQGVAIARMAFADRFVPRGAVWKYHNGHWNEPGLGGRVTPIFPAATAWQREDADAFWGPSVHWNTFLTRYVMLLNRACCTPGWPQEGIYISFSADLSQPETWKQPERVLEGGGWYPHALGLGSLETGAIAGQYVRLFTANSSEWELVFDTEPE